MQDRLHLLARRIAVPHPRGGTVDVTAPLPPHMRQSWNLIGFDAKRYDPIEAAPAAGSARRRALLSAEQKQMILGGTAAKILKIYSACDDVGSLGVVPAQAGTHNH